MTTLKSLLIGIGMFIVSVVIVILIVLGQISMYILAPLMIAVVSAMAYYDMKRDGTL
jgi:hypothetical protein